ncbi:unnamed protein product [Phytophthora fragariaefolia]|uniref:Unnamed protein product n=1 Tax=Phytophthora fragariaefolia TaxID=1490495 RepID=A0A9W7DBK8_9STRA|nr:unnamed protein product [Phytophthora fragariaefolia]
MLTQTSQQQLHLHELVTDLMDHLKQQQQQTITHIDSKLSDLQSSVTSMMNTLTQLTSGAASVRLSVDWGNSVAAASHCTARTAETDIPSKYKLLRSLKAVHQVWQEWSVGINGDPAVRELDKQYGALFPKYALSPFYQQPVAFTSSAPSSMVSSCLALHGVFFPSFTTRVVFWLSLSEWALKCSTLHQVDSCTYHDVATSNNCCYPWDELDTSQ